MIVISRMLVQVIKQGLSHQMLVPEFETRLVQGCTSGAVATPSFGGVLPDLMKQGGFNARD